MSKKLFVTTILIGLFISPIAFSQETVETHTSTKVTRPLAIDGETNQVKPAIQRFIERINMARVALATANSKEAQFDLDEAEKHLKFIKSNSGYQEVTKQTTISSGQVVYDTDTKYNSYYVPLEEGPVVVKDYVATENQAGEGNKKAIAVKSAKVVYLNVDLSGTQGEEAIATARAAIAEGKLDQADETLSKLLDEVTIADSVQSVPKVVAQDNLKLAHTFLLENNYVAARFALTQAEEALKSVQGEPAGKLRGRIEQIRDLVMQQTENTAQKARTQIKDVQGDLDKLS